MTSASVVAPVRPVASRDPVSAKNLIIVEHAEPEKGNVFKDARKSPKPCHRIDAENHSTLTERVISVLEKHSA
jgi:hypothetical protein